MKYLVVLMFMSGVAFGKPIDVQKITKKEGFKGELEASYERQTGDEDETEMSSETVMQYMKGKDLGLVFIQGEDKRKDGQSDEVSNLQHIRYRRFTTNKFGWEGFAQREEDSARALTLGRLAGAGPFFRLYHNYLLNVTYGLALAREYEQYRDDPASLDTRFHTYVTAGVRFPDKFLGGMTVYLDRNTDEGSDLRTYLKSSLKYKLRDNLTVGVNYECIRDTLPPAGVAETNTKTSTTIGLEF